MDKKRSGQAAVEYVIVLVLFTGVALEGWRFLYPTISALYDNFTSRRAGLLGMYP